MTGIYALLLAFAIAAGAATTSDAFAQSNTDRLIGLVDTTNRNNGMLDAIQNVLGGLGEQITAVQNAVTTLAESVAALSEDTADMAADVAGLTGKVDTANERIAGLDGKVDAIGMGVAGLTGKVDAATMHVDGVGAKVDAVNMHINELSGKVDAANICTSDLNTRVETIAAYAADLNTKTASVGSTMDAVQKEVGVLKTTMAEHAGANQLDPSYAEKLDMITDIRTALDALGERPDNTAALDAISDGIKANSARIAALEDTINMIDSQLAGVTGKLGTVETAVEQRVGPAPTSLHKGEEKYKVTIGHFGDSAKGKVSQNPAVPSKLTVTFAFTCKEDVFVGNVMTSKPRSAISGWGHSASIEQRVTTIMVEDQLLWHNYYYKGGDRGVGANFVFLNTTSRDFDLRELKANDTLDFTSTWLGNHTNGTSTSGSLNPNVSPSTGVGLYALAKHGENLTTAIIPDHLRNHLNFFHPPPPYTKAQLGAIDIYEITVEYYSATEKADCSFKRTSGFSTELDKAAQKVLSVRTKTVDRLVNGFQERLNCNGLPTMITGVNTEVPGGLTLNQHSTFRLLSGEGDKEKTHSVFKFNPNGTITHSSGDFPFTFEGAPLRVNGTLAGANGLLVVVDYKTTEDNSCR